MSFYEGWDFVVWNGEFIKPWSGKCRLKTEDF